MNWLITYQVTEYGRTDQGPRTVVTNLNPIDLMKAKSDSEYQNRRCAILFAMELKGDLPRQAAELREAWDE